MKKNGKLIQTIRIYNQDIGMEFDIEKFAMLIMKIGKIETTVCIERIREGKLQVLEK